MPTSNQPHGGLGSTTPSQRCELCVGNEKKFHCRLNDCYREKRIQRIFFAKIEMAKKQAELDQLRAGL